MVAKWTLSSMNVIEFSSWQPRVTKCFLSWWQIFVPIVTCFQSPESNMKIHWYNTTTHIFVYNIAQAYNIPLVYIVLLGSTLTSAEPSVIHHDKTFQWTAIHCRSRLKILFNEWSPPHPTILWMLKTRYRSSAAILEDSNHHHHCPQYHDNWKPPDRLMIVSIFCVIRRTI